MCKVSVIVPFYNVEEYIERSIKSVVEQSLKDIEIILVNDGSKDGSEEIAQKYINMYPNKIKYLKKKNGGLADARNYAIPYATGEYIAFLDSDDYIEEDMYKEMYETAKIDNADVVECDYFWEYPEETIRSSGKTYKNRHDMLVNSRVVAWNKLIKREVLINSGIEFPVGLRYEDVEFFYKLIPYISSISIVKKPFVHYVQRESSISNVQNEKTADIIKILNNVIDYYKEKNIFEEYKVDLEYIYSRYILCSSLLRMVMIEDKNKREKVINYAWDSLNKKFPNWKKNPYLKEKNQKNYYMLSITPQTLKIYSKLGRIRSIRKKIQEKFI